MKKILFLTTMVLVLAGGTAYAAHGSDAWTGSAYGMQPKNGITVFCTGPVTFDLVPLGAAPMSAKPGYNAESSAAGGYRGEASAPEPDNGVTIFSGEPVSFDAVPAGAGPVD